MVRPYVVKVKICGITNLEDAQMSVEAGADALGFVFFRGSPRYISPELAADIISTLPPFIQTVGLFVNEDHSTVNSIADQCGLDVIQLHGDESPEYCTHIRRRIIKAFRVKDSSTLATMSPYRVSGYLLDAWSPDAFGGTGRTFNWKIAAQAVEAGFLVILAGGLAPENVAGCIAQVHPYGVDVSSGVEVSPGCKDWKKVRAFVTNAGNLPADYT